MATRKKSDEQKLAAQARKVIDQLKAASDVQALADRCMTQISNRSLRQAVLQAAASAPDVVTAALARSALSSKDSRTARVGAELLADMSDSPTALAVLKHSFEMDDDVVRTRAVEALESFDNVEVLQFLPGALTDESTPVRRVAATMMSLIVATRYHPLAGPVLDQFADTESPICRAVLENEDEHVRRQVAQSLGFVNSESVLPLLKQLGKDEGVEVRQEAALALAGLGTPAALEVMCGMVDDPSYRVVSSALDTLMAKVGPTDQMLEYLDGSFAHEDNEVRRHAVLMLDRFDAEKARPVLEKAMRDSDFEVARRAAEVLTKLTGTAGLHWLSEKMAGQVDRKSVV